MEDIPQLKIELAGSPLIWRRILIGKQYSFFTLHQIIRIVMGWNNHQRFEFNMEGSRIGEIKQNVKESYHCFYIYL